MPEQRSNRVNVLLDEEHATKLHRLADRTHLNAGTLARSLLSTALDQADPDAATVTALLDAIPGAFERAQQGLLEAQAGRVVRLEDL
jgi:predicted transcriptional regulator